MSRSDRPRVDWRGWIALAWAIPFAVLYARMILEQRAPGGVEVVVVVVMRQQHEVDRPDFGRRYRRPCELA